MPKCDFTLWHGSQFDPWCSWKCLSVKLPVANKCSSSWYGLMVITWKYNTMIKSWLWSQSWLRQTCNVFLFTFIKHLFKRRDVLHIGCLVKKKKKMMYHIVLIRTIRFSVEQVKQKPLGVFITWKVHLSRIQKQYAYSNPYSNPVYHQHLYLVLHSFIFSKKVFHRELLDVVLPFKNTTPQKRPSDGHNWVYTNWCNVLGYN